MRPKVLYVDLDFDNRGATILYRKTTSPLASLHDHFTQREVAVEELRTYIRELFYLASATGLHQPSGRSPNLSGIALYRTGISYGRHTQRRSREV